MANMDKMTARSIEMRILAPANELRIGWWVNDDDNFMIESSSSSEAYEGSRTLQAILKRMNEISSGLGPNGWAELRFHGKGCYDGWVAWPALPALSMEAAVKAVQGSIETD